MPAVLSDDFVCSPEVPLSWEPIIRGLDEFVRLELSLCHSRTKVVTAKQRAQLAKLHDDLVEGSARLLEPEAISGQTSDDDVAVFARALLVLMRLNDSVAADRKNVLDTAGSRTLGEFQADFHSTSETRERMITALCSFPEVTGERLKSWEEQVEYDAEDARRKQGVVRAIRDEFGLWPGESELRRNIHRFFCACYPDTGIEADEVELIVTGCMIFFCLPFEGVELRTERFRQADAEAQTPVIRFLKQAKKFSQWQFAHFPVFGCLRGEDLPEELRQRLADRCGLSVAVVSREIGRLTAIVPLHEIDKYVVHDVWGHGWQASLLRFDGLYEQLAEFAVPLSCDEPTQGTAGVKMRLSDCFSGRGNDMLLNEELFEQFVELKIVERLPVAMTPVIAEVIADVAEFKYVELRPDRADALLSSSLMHAFPSKLDLIVQDVPYYFRQATKIFRLWASRENRQQRLVDELIQRGASPRAARRECDRAVACWRCLEADIYMSEIKWRQEGDRLHVNVMTRLALNFLGLHRAKLEAYKWMRTKKVGSLPLKSFRDLLLICAAVYFETDPPRNLWRIDEFISLRIEPLCERLAAALDEPHSR